MGSRAVWARGFTACDGTLTGEVFPGQPCVAEPRWEEVDTAQGEVRSSRYKQYTPELDVITSQYMDDSRLTCSEFT